LYIIATILFSSFSVTQDLYRKWREHILWEGLYWLEDTSNPYIQDSS